MDDSAGTTYLVAFVLLLSLAVSRSLHNPDIPKHRRQKGHGSGGNSGDSGNYDNGGSDSSGDGGSGGDGGGGGGE